MNRFSHHIVSVSRRITRPGYAAFRTVLLTLLSLVTLSLSAQEQGNYADGLDERSIILNIRTNHEDPNYPITNLGISGSDKRYFSGQPAAGWTEGAFIEVELKDGGLTYNSAEDNSENEEDKECLLIYVRRDKNDAYANAHPTAFRVEGQFADKDGNLESGWHELFYVYLLYRGPETQEFSSKVLVNKLWKKVSENPNETNLGNLADEVNHDMVLKKMRFFVTANNNREFTKVGDKNYRDMSLARFDVLKVKKGENYSNIFKDRLHLESDYATDFWDYDFIHTKGIVDPVFNNGGWSQDILDKVSDLPKDINIKFPDFEFLTSTYHGKDQYGKLKEKAKFHLEPGQQRQQTHTVEHVVYAIPGDVVALYPYYQMHDEKVTQYQENFSHWYNYSTGGRLTYTAPWSGIDYELLDFATDPTFIQKTNNNGFFGGKELTTRAGLRVYTVDDFIRIVNECNDNNRGAYIEIMNDLDFTDKNDIPMLGPNGKPFTGIFNGNGHTIKGLVYNLPEENGVGLIGHTGNGARVENIVLDKTCTFIGQENVGLIGYHENFFLYVRNVHTEATIYGYGSPNNNGGRDDGNAGGIVGFANGGENRIKIENCYVGGVIGKYGDNIGTGSAAIISSIGTDQINVNADPTWFRNVIVNCDIYGMDGNRRYFRRRNQTIDGLGHIQTSNCYGNLHDSGLHQGVNSLNEIMGSGEQKDWAQLEAFNTWNGKYPSAQAIPAPGEDEIVYPINNVEDYQRAVPTINALDDSSNVRIVFNANVDFGNRNDIPLLGTEQHPFKGIFDGNGHTIGALRYDLPSQIGVGLIGYSGDGARVENITLWNGFFVGSRNVGLIGQHKGGHLTVRNSRITATCVGKAIEGELCAAGILGYAGDTNNNILTVEDCYIECTIGENGNDNRKNAAIVGWLGTENIPDNASDRSLFRNVVVQSNVFGAESNDRLYYRNNTKIDTESGISYGHIKVENCYGSLHSYADCQDFTYIPFGDNLSNLPAYNDWDWEKLNPRFFTSSVMEVNAIPGSRVNGTYATFFCPRNPYVAAGNQESLPFNELGEKVDEEDELIIAADFSQEFNKVAHVKQGQDGRGSITEPIISSRHIFRIRDGKKFADDFSGSEQNNENFIRKNQRMVSARTGVPFQIRFDNPIPVSDTIRSNYYYKLADNDYRRVCKMEIRLLDAQTRQVIPKGHEKYIEFYEGETFKGRGTRVIDGVKYNLCGGEDAQYYRMLMCDEPKPYEYIVQLIGKDVKGNTIKVYDKDKNSLSPDQRRDLVVMEYHISFLPIAGASMVTEEELYGNNLYKAARQEVLEETYGNPGVIDFDEYIKLNNNIKDESLKNGFVTSSKTDTPYPVETDWDENSWKEIDNDDIKDADPGRLNPKNGHGMVSTYFKWPVHWDQSNYSFGYNNRHDYNMYMLATHSQETPYRGAANQFRRNREGDGTGLFDRRYYQTLRQYKEDVKNGVENPTPVEQGYFYYVNAATDPGVASKIRIENICQGATVHVSAWLAEFSDNPESANLSFNFVAVLDDKINQSSTGSEGSGTSSNGSVVNDGLKGGDRIVLHSFITGYVEKNSYALGENNKVIGNKYGYKIKKSGQVGEWVHVYYSFVPRLSEFSNHGITSDMIHHYELELDNNCKSSDGADYAIDDIRVYIAKPEVFASQLTPACGDEVTSIRVESPFATLLQTCGKKEALKAEDGETIDLFYTFIDKSKFDTIYDAKKANGEDAYNQSVVRFSYDGRKGISESGETGDSEKGEIKDSETKEPEDRIYGYLTFNTYLFNNKGSNPSEASRREAEDGRDMIVFTSDLTDKDFKLGKEYYVVLYTPLGRLTSIDGKEWDYFDMIGNDCAKVCTLFVRSSNVVKIDGVIVEDMNQLVVCENQSPVVQVNVWGKTTDDKGEYVEVEKNEVFDWYLGSMEEYIDQGTEENPHPSLKEAMDEFRSVEAYKELKSLDGVEPSGKFTESMLNILKGAADKLRLYESSYLIPPTTLREDGTNEVSLMVIPLPKKDYVNVMVCKEPTELTLYVRSKSPVIRHGFKGITYPMDDVPLRIGLDRLRSAKSEGGVGFDMKTIEMPIRTATSTDSKVKVLKLVNESAWNGVKSEVKSGCIVLVETDDEDYKDLGTIGIKDNKEFDTDHLLWVGEVRKLVANTTTDATENLFDVRFDENFKFKEGYYYRMRFQYSESLPSSQGEAGVDNDVMAAAEEDGNEPGGDEVEEPDEPVVCNGHDVFTLKIVPKYLLWTGSKDDEDKANLNWNNDANWRRVTSGDLYAANKAANTHRHYVTDGKEDAKDVNPREKGYAPLDFTHVIIPGAFVGLDEETSTANEVNTPYLYKAAESKDDATIMGYKWYAKTTPASNVYADFPTNGVGKATELIQFDMAAYDLSAKVDGDPETGCRPWYMNTCAQIHFLPGATIMNQQELSYKRAWVDVELDKQCWYTLAMPLQEVYAGDFYLPSATGRERSELFNDMTFDFANNVHNRFMPAVYQRGWDKSTARVYEVNSTETDVRNVIVKSYWSHVYNDVKELYGKGNGFSIKTDVTAMASGNQPNKVKFRLPKNDASFDYYTQDGNTSGHTTPIARSGEVGTAVSQSDEANTVQYRLNKSNGTLTATTANVGTQTGDEPGTYFLIGNPFMTYMDIKEFLTKNSTKLYQKYWIVTGNGQIAGSIADGMISTDPAEGMDPSVIAPMQGFFVKAKAVKSDANGVKVELDYNESMMRRSAAAGKNLPAATRSGSSDLNALRIFAVNEGNVSSSAMIVADGYTEANEVSEFDVEAIDNRDLELPSTVYTVKNGKALSINFNNDPEGVEVGVLADEETETVVRFDGVDAVYGMKLLDKRDGSLTTLFDGMEVKVKGSAVGKLYLVSEASADEFLTGVEWYTEPGKLVAVDLEHTGSLEVNVFDTLGRKVASAADGSDSIYVSLSSGVYVVEITTSRHRTTAKIKM